MGCRRPARIPAQEAGPGVLPPEDPQTVVMSVRIGKRIKFFYLNPLTNEKRECIFSPYYRGRKSRADQESFMRKFSGIAFWWFWFRFTDSSVRSICDD